MTPAEWDAEDSVTSHPIRESTMVGTRTRFSGEQAPCGKTVDGDHYRDNDDDGLLIRDEFFTCGCRITRHEYHDGSVHIRAIRHDGKVVADEFTRD
jgi:hypothetical protein